MTEKEFDKLAEQTVIGLLTLSDARLRNKMEQVVVKDNPQSVLRVINTLQHLTMFLRLNG